MPEVLDRLVQLYTENNKLVVVKKWHVERAKYPEEGWMLLKRSTDKGVFVVLDHLCTPYWNAPFCTGFEKHNRFYSLIYA